MFTDGEKETPTQETKQNSGDPTTSSTNPFEDKLKGIVNEKGEQKYKDLESALEALKHSQEFIPQVLNEKKTVEQKLLELEQELEKRKSVEEAVEQLLGKTTPAQKEEGTTAPKTSGLDEDKVRQLLEGMLDQRTQSEKQDANLRTVVTQLTEKYGEQAKEVIRTRAAELGTTPTELEKIARQNPNMALTLLGGVELKSSAPSKPTQTTQRKTPTDDLPPPSKKLITGGARREDIMNEWNAIKGSVYKKYGVDN